MIRSTIKIAAFVLGFGLLIAPGLAFAASGCAAISYDLNNPLSFLHLGGTSSCEKTGTDVVASPDTTRSCPNLKKSLYLRASGAAVTKLQEFLAWQGYFAATPTGYFGKVTLKAVEAWQLANDIVARGAPGFGHVGPKTRRAIAQACGPTATLVGASSTNITAAVVGTPQPVFTYKTQACTSSDIPDVPARAYHNAAGQVVLIDSSSGIDINSPDEGNRLAVGPALDSVVHQCTVVYPSHNDIAQDNWRYQEWLMAPYTLNGTDVYAIIHNEWYAWLAGQRCDNQGDGWLNAFTLAVSHDGGASFVQPSDYLVRYPATQWSSSFSCTDANPTRYGDFEGSNIIAKDGYYYRLFHYIPEPNSGAQDGICLMRTNDLKNASSWEVWNGNGYTQSKTAPCKPIPNLSYYWSLTYNRYLNEYVVVGGSPAWHGPAPFYLQISPDLLTWSNPIAISGVDQGAVLEYPSLLDPTDTSRNFENTGQTPYLYYTRDNLVAPSDMDRDLLRVQIQLMSTAPPAI